MWLLFVGFGDLVTLLHDVAFWHLEDLEYDIAKQVKWLPHGVVEQQCSAIWHACRAPDSGRESV